MKQSPMLAFESSAFTQAPGEDKKTNPGIYGKALAQWLADRLREAGVPAQKVIAEDFGWCVSVKSDSHSLYVVGASSQEGPNQWRVFAFVEGGVIARLRGKDTSAESLKGLFDAVKQMSRVRSGRREPAAGTVSAESTRFVEHRNWKFEGSGAKFEIS